MTRKPRRGHKRSHEFIIRITMDKPCSQEHARRAVSDCIHGEFYPVQIDDRDPGEFKVRGFKAVRTGRAK